MALTKDGKFERSDDYSSTAYFYLDRPENNLPKLDAAEKEIEVERLETFCNPEKRIPKYIAGLTGITDDARTRAVTAI